MTEKKNEAGPGFEKALARIEKIVADMEGGELSLEKMIAHFEEGQSLLKRCTATLDGMEKKVEALVERGGELATEPLDEERAGPSARPDREIGSDELF